MSCPLSLRRTKDGKPEIDFETDVTDFRLPSIQSQDIKNGLSRSGSMRHEQDVPEMQYSLKVGTYRSKSTLYLTFYLFLTLCKCISHLCSQAYLSILYLKPRTQIFLRGKRNIPRLISKGLNIIEHDVYNPHFTVSLCGGVIERQYRVCVSVSVPDPSQYIRSALFSSCQTSQTH